MIEYLQKIARQASEIMVNNTNQINITHKTGKRDIVTNCDIQVQNYLYKQLKEKDSNITFIGEENEHNQISAKGTFCIIDPIDGTMNFSHNVCHSCISIAYGTNGELTDSCVYNPYLNEMFYAKRGHGAYLNEHKLTCDNTIPLSASLVCFGTASYYDELKDIVFDLAKTSYEQAIDIRRTGSAALDLCLCSDQSFQSIF